MIVATLAGCGGASATSAEASEPPTAVDPSDSPSSRQRSAIGCTGSVDVLGAIAAVRARDEAVRACYETLLRADPDAQVTVETDLYVAADGRVERARIRSSNEDAAFIECMQLVLAGIRFPAPTDGSCAIIMVPHAFRPASLADSSVSEEAGTD